MLQRLFRLENSPFSLPVVSPWKEIDRKTPFVSLVFKCESNKRVTCVGDIQINTVISIGFRSFHKLSFAPTGNDQRNNRAVIQSDSLGESSFTKKLETSIFAVVKEK